MTSIIQSVKPIQGMVMPLTSTGKHILKRRQVEILPNEQTEFKYDGNDTIIFNISSQSECLDGLDSHVRLDLLCAGNANRVLEVGGAHALFKELLLRTVNGTQIQRIQNYNRFYAMMSMANHSPQHVELVEAAAGDSVDAGADVLIPYKTFVNGVNATPLVDIPFAAAAIFDQANGNGFGARAFLLGAGSLAGTIAANDELIISVVNTYDNGNGNQIRYETYYATVIAAGLNDVNNAVRFRINASNFGDNNVPPHAISGADAANRIVHISKFQRNPVAADLANVYLSQRAEVARSADAVTLTFKPCLEFLNKKHWIPLMFIKQGIALEMKLERPEFALSKNLLPADEALNADVLAYTISKPRYVAMMITPDETVVQDYLNMFNGNGIELPFVGYDHDLSTLSGSAAATPSIVMRPGLRSCRHVFSVIQSSRLSQDIGPPSRGGFALSTFFRAGLTSYQYKSGSEQYPDRPVKCNRFSSEVFNQLMLSTGQHSGTLWNVRFSPSDWRSENTVQSSTAAVPGVNVAITNESTKYIISTRLDRDDAFYTGLDLSINTLNLEMSFDAFPAPQQPAFGDRLVHSWIGHDITVNISSAGFIVKK